MDYRNNIKTAGGKHFPLLPNSTLLLISVLPVQRQSDQAVRLVGHKQGDIQHIPIQFQVIQGEPYTEFYLVWEQLFEFFQAFAGRIGF